MAPSSMWVCRRSWCIQTGTATMWLPGRDKTGLAWAGRWRAAWPARGLASFMGASCSLQGLCHIKLGLWFMAWPLAEEQVSLTEGTLFCREQWIWDLLRIFRIYLM
jgi:hypothetical protein